MYHKWGFSPSKKGGNDRSDDRPSCTSRAAYLDDLDRFLGAAFFLYFLRRRLPSESDPLEDSESELDDDDDDDDDESLSLLLQRELHSICGSRQRLGR
jgi:hypothetical protein